MNTYCILYVGQNGQDIKITYTNRMLQARTISLIICVYMCYAPRTIIQRLHKSPSIIRTNDYKIITLKSSHMCRVFSLHIYALVFSFFFFLFCFVQFFFLYSFILKSLYRQPCLLPTYFTSREFYLSGIIQYLRSTYHTLPQPNPMSNAVRRAWGIDQRQAAQPGSSRTLRRAFCAHSTSSSPQFLTIMFIPVQSQSTLLALGTHSMLCHGHHAFHSRGQHSGAQHSGAQHSGAQLYNYGNEIHIGI